MPPLVWTENTWFSRGGGPVKTIWSLGGGSLLQKREGKAGGEGRSQACMRGLEDGYLLGRGGMNGNGSLRVVTAPAREAFWAQADEKESRGRVFFQLRSQGRIRWCECSPFPHTHPRHTLSSTLPPIVSKVLSLHRLAVIPPGGGVTDVFFWLETPPPGMGMKHRSPKWCFFWRGMRHVVFLGYFFPVQFGFTIDDS